MATLLTHNIWSNRVNTSTRSFANVQVENWGTVAPIRAWHRYTVGFRQRALHTLRQKLCCAVVQHGASDQLRYEYSYDSMQSTAAFDHIEFYKSRCSVLLIHEVQV